MEFRRCTNSRPDPPITSDKTYTRSGTLTLDQSALGANARNATVANWWNGQIAELAVAYTALGDTDRQALMAAQKAYYQTA